MHVRSPFHNHLRKMTRSTPYLHIGSYGGGVRLFFPSKLMKGDETMKKSSSPHHNAIISFPLPPSFFVHALSTPP